MRLRVFLPLLCFGLIAVAAIVWLAGSATAQARTQEVQLQRAAALSHIGERARSAFEQGDIAELERYLTRFTDTYAEPVLVVDAAGSVAVASGNITRTGAAGAATANALRGVPQWSLRTATPWDTTTAYMAEPITADGGNALGAVTLAVNEGSLRSGILTSWVWIGASGLAGLALLLAAAAFWSRWVLRPVQALDEATHALTEQRDVVATLESGPPELRNLSRSFSRMAASVQSALEQQRGLVADASHQLRNPLAAIRLRIDGLGADPHGSATEPASAQLSAAELAEVNRDLDRLEHTVDRMLLLANAEHRANERAHEHDDEREAHTTAAELIAPHTVALRAAGLTVVADTDSSPVRVACPPADLAEIVEILLDNAAKYVAAGARVTVRLDAGHAAATLTVSDSGAGLSDADLALVGQRFWRARQHQQLLGTGLGYAIVEQLARANGGTLMVDRAPEGGLRTRVRFPA